VVIFPEGTRRTGAEIGPVASGAAYLALKTGVPIVPVGIGGSEHPVLRRRGIPWWSRVTVVVGEPIPVTRSEGTVKRSAIAAIDAVLTLRLQACFDRARAASATRSERGVPDSGHPGETGQRG
jgi:1-acyl-sn-glycerol-3-phosphate acyltransferase